MLSGRIDPQLLLLARKIGSRGGRGIRRVRTPEGSRKYGLPIGAIITKDAIKRASKRFPGLQVPEDSDRRSSRNSVDGTSAPRITAAQLGEKLKNDPEFQNPTFSKPTGDQKVSFGKGTHNFPSGTKVFHSKKNPDGYAIARTPDYDVHLLTPEGNSIDVKGDSENTINERLDDLDGPNDPEFDVEEFGTDPNADDDTTDGEDEDLDYTEFESYEDVPEYLSEEYIQTVSDNLASNGIDEDTISALEDQLRAQNDEIKQKWEEANDPVAAARNKQVKDLQDQIAALQKQLDAINNPQGEGDQQSDDTKPAESPNKRTATPDQETASGRRAPSDQKASDRTDDAVVGQSDQRTQKPSDGLGQSDDLENTPKKSSKSARSKQDAADRAERTKPDGQSAPGEAADRNLKAIEGDAESNPLGVGMGRVNNKMVYVRRNRRTGTTEYSTDSGDVFESREELLSSLGDGPEKSDLEVDTSDMSPSDLSDEQLSAVIDDLEAGSDRLNSDGRKRLRDLQSEKRDRSPEPAPASDASSRAEDYPGQSAERSDVLEARPGDRYLFKFSSDKTDSANAVEWEVGEDGRFHAADGSSDFDMSLRDAADVLDTGQFDLIPSKNNKDRSKSKQTPSSGDTATDSWLSDAPAGSSVQSSDDLVGVRDEDGKYDTPLGKVDKEFFSPADVEGEDSTVVSPNAPEDGRPAGAVKLVEEKSDLRDVRSGDSLSLQDSDATAEKNSDGSWKVDVGGLTLDVSSDDVVGTDGSWWTVKNQDLPETSKKRNFSEGDLIDSIDALHQVEVGSRLRYTFKTPSRTGATESEYEVLEGQKVRKVGGAADVDFSSLRNVVSSGRLSFIRGNDDNDRADAPEEKTITSVSDYSDGDKIVDYKHLKSMKPGTQVTMTIPSKNNGGKATTVVLTRTDDNKDAAGFMFLVGKRGAGYNSFGENNASIFQAIYDGRLYFGDVSRLPDAPDDEHMDGNWDTTPNIPLWDGGPMVSEYDLRTFIDAQVYARAMQGTYYNTSLLPLHSPFRSQQLRKDFSERAVKKYSVYDADGKVITPARHKPAMIRYAAERLGLQFDDPGAALIPDDLELSDFKTKVTIGKWANKNGKPSAESDKMGMEQIEVTVADIKTALSVLDNMDTMTDADRTKADKILKRVMAMRGSSLQDMNVALGIAAYYGVRRYENGKLKSNIAAARQRDKRNNKEYLRWMLMEQMEGREPGYYGIPEDETWKDANGNTFTNRSTLTRPAVNSDNDPDYVPRTAETVQDPVDAPEQVVDTAPDTGTANTLDQPAPVDQPRDMVDNTTTTPDAVDTQDPGTDEALAQYLDEADVPDTTAGADDLLTDQDREDLLQGNDVPEMRSVEDYLDDRGAKSWGSDSKARTEASKAQHKEAWNSDAVYVVLGDSTVKLKHTSKDREGYELDSTETESFARLAQQIHDSNIPQSDKDQLEELLDENSLSGKRMFIDREGSVIAALDGDRIIGPFSADGRDGHRRQEITKKAVRAGGRYAITPDDSSASRLADAGLVPSHVLPDGSVVSGYYPEKVGSKYSGTLPNSQALDQLDAASKLDAERAAYESNPFHITLDQGEMGDGHIRDANGKRTKMWGQYGAAGLMVRHVDDDGTERFFMVQRGKSLSNALKWQFAGGAINSNENDNVGAARELYEEVKPPEGWLGGLTSVGTNKFDDAATGWHYSNIAVDTPEQFDPTLDYESNDAKWLTRQEIADLMDSGDLVPGVEASIRKTLSLWGGTEADALPDPTPRADEKPTHGLAGDPESVIGTFTGGSNGGREYTLQMSDGTTARYFVKPTKSEDQGRQEALASALYREAGVAAPEVDFSEDDKQVYSKMMDGVTGNVPRGGVDKAREDFAIDAWLANWDIRLGDNVMFDSDGSPIRLDNGGALEYRARGAKKGTQGTSGFGNSVTELDTLRDPRNLGHQIFGSKGNQPDSWEISSAQRVVDIPDDRIREMVADHNLPDSLADTLIARRDYIAKRYSLTPKPREVSAPKDKAPELTDNQVNESLSETATPAVTADTTPVRGSFSEATPSTAADAGEYAPSAGTRYTFSMSDGTTKDYAVLPTKSSDTGKSAALASALYSELGVGAIRAQYDEDENGDNRVISELVKVADDSATGVDADEDFKRGFVADAWLANWVAPDSGKSVVTDDGSKVRTDLRGVLDYRMSGQKKTDFDGTVTELDSMRTQGNGVFTYGARNGVLVDDWEFDGAVAVVGLSDQRIRDLVSEHGREDSLADTLIARRDYIAERYGLSPKNDNVDRDLMESIDSAESFVDAQRAAGSSKVDYIRENVPSGTTYNQFLRDSGGVSQAFSKVWKDKFPDKPDRINNASVNDVIDIEDQSVTADDIIDLAAQFDFSQSVLDDVLATTNIPRNQNTQVLLQAILRQRGFTEEAPSLEWSEFQAELDGGRTHIFRTVRPGPRITASSIIDDHKTRDGWYSVGTGGTAHGVGLYFSESLTESTGYGWDPGSAWMDAAFDTKSSRIGKALDFARGYGWGATHTKMDDVVSAIQSRTDLTQEQKITLTAVFSDKGTASAILGYDALYGTNHTRFNDYVVHNRGKIVFSTYSGTKVSDTSGRTGVGKGAGQAIQIREQLNVPKTTPSATGGSGQFSSGQVIGNSQVATLGVGSIIQYTKKDGSILTLRLTARGWVNTATNRVQKWMSALTPRGRSKFTVVTAF